MQHFDLFFKIIRTNKQMHYMIRRVFLQPDSLKMKGRVQNIQKSLKLQ